MGDDIKSTTPTENKYHCADYLHTERGPIPAAWFVQAAHKHAVNGDLIPYGNGRAAAVCDEHLADGVHFCTEADGITQVIVRRENVDTTSVELSEL